MFNRVTLGLITVALASLPALAQSPTPIVVQAVGQGTVATTTPAAIAPSGATTEATLKILLEVKAANEEILRKQTATLLQLEEMEKAAEQIKIYTKRG